MDAIDHPLDASLEALRTKLLRWSREPHPAPSTMSSETQALLEDINRRFDRFEAVLAEGFAETRRLRQVLHEEIMSRLASLDERRRN